MKNKKIYIFNVNYIKYSVKIRMNAITSRELTPRYIIYKYNDIF